MEEPVRVALAQYVARSDPCTHRWTPHRSIASSAKPRTARRAVRPRLLREARTYMVDQFGYVDAELDLL
ncbi:hypothetical protein AB0N62_40550 [Streptomyces sp. NPDC093982]|uniref:hypothetical protein n=1 Tax=Streptomyces sp. NPDC093982 TaxID=3155077 RepID=UPI0034470B7D